MTIKYKMNSKRKGGCENINARIFKNLFNLKINKKLP